MTFKERYNPKIPLKPYLIQPVDPSIYAITEGFIYSQQEHSIHGYYLHAGIDFDSPYGTPVRAAASGFAVASYHRFVSLNRDGSMHLYQGKPLGFGFGYMIQIYHPEEVSGIPGGRITQYGHLSFISPRIPLQLRMPKQVDYAKKVATYYEKHNTHARRSPVQSIITEQQHLMEQYPWTQTWYGFSGGQPEEKEAYLLTPTEITELSRQPNTFVTWVEQGEEIGKVGNSAIIWGDATQPEASTLVNQQVLPQLETWDEPHLHFEEAARDPNTGQKLSRRDPFFLYKSAKWYQKRFIEKTLFIDY